MTSQGNRPRRLGNDRGLGLQKADKIHGHQDQWLPLHRSTDENREM